MSAWLEVKDGDEIVREIFNRHYSRRRYQDGRAPKLFVGPGEKTVLLRSDNTAILVWRRFKSQDEQKGVNCAVFRNEGHELSSKLIREAEEIAWTRWPFERLYTYVDARKVRAKADPGRCFIMAGWKQCGVSKKARLLIFEKFPTVPVGLVSIQRAKGRIAGWAEPACPVDVLWCGTNRPRKKHGHRKDGWSFPPAVRELLLQQIQGMTCLHLFGGRADFGVRMDIDPSTEPHVVADAFFPPFPKNSFDVVILDPPYYQIHGDEKRALLIAASWVARRWVYWFHTIWAADRSVIPLHAWAVRVGDQCAMRVLQQFAVRQPKRPPLSAEDFQRGYPLKYKRFSRREHNLSIPFGDLPPGPVVNGEAR